MGIAGVIIWLKRPHEPTYEVLLALQVGSGLEGIGV